MRYARPSLFSIYATGLTAFLLVSAILLIPTFARAGQAKAPKATQDSCTCPPAQSTQRPKPARLNAPPRVTLGIQDEIAALESVQLALSQVADGSTYVWHRSHGLLSGIVQPTSSFKDAEGQVCRHVVVILNSLDTTSKTEAIACRMPDGIWQLDG
ncbi:MAG: hypothetical protein KDJ17_01435 [Hyphomicrobiaceae bacterium]|nr:hypothetical protein [Hyphomicrobiaceae bacterium]